MTDREYLDTVARLPDWTEFDAGGPYDSLRGRLTQRRNGGESLASAVDAELRLLERADAFHAGAAVRAEQEALVRALVAAANADVRLGLHRLTDADHTFVEDLNSQQVQSMGHVPLDDRQLATALRLIRKAEQRKQRRA